ncbi:hypothetical protein ACLBV5_04615 [Brevundimonas sp. M1A4_2e]
MMLLRFAVLAASCALVGCGLAGQKSDVGVLVLECTGQWSATGTAAEPTERSYRVNFETKTIEYKDVRFGTWHFDNRGQRTFRADTNTISLDGQDPPNTMLNLSSTYTLQFDRRTGRVVDGQRQIDISGHEAPIEEAFEGTCHPASGMSNEQKF